MSSRRVPPAPAADRRPAGRRPAHPAGNGPNVVAIGGGRGLAATLRAARGYAGHTTAIVSTADDSGSSGRLRKAAAMPALGDLRRCLTALAGAEDELLGRALEYRFGGTDVAGHALGNVLLAGLAAVTGDFIAAVDELGRMLGIDPHAGRVIPATVQPVTLRASTADGTEISGQYAISQTRGVHRVMLDPPDAKATDGAAEAIRQADQIVLGPGSVYTSILAALLVHDLRATLAARAARCVYVCNLEPEHAETLGYDVAAHVAALRRHGVEPDTVLVQDGQAMPLGDVGAEVVPADLAGRHPATHDSGKLAAALAALAG